ncbi:MAG: hypothetical protein E6235_09240 [Anaerococcus vaginalis]|uniref:hypothetical protein n=1 Tax=Bacteria TaxID=2 RepID=UPI001033BE7D|nr:MULTISPECIES: hypothetical protein [Bacteria]HCI6154353.1 hypothetical protein [Klebsiella variicola subsp. variicola]MDU5087187.1 hypothetical protein [Anaerococcus vaginalis]VGG99139.1 Uncharacterised protein [Klebsiella quasipneumoniae]VGH18993.1 Uncharacterised protein [Klebsiella quasipneumoniae]HCI6075089.1 hypothetical protein [Klebsiella pneumoniae]
MPKAAPKSNKIASELIDVLKAKVKIDEFTFRKYLREIDSLNDRFSDDYLKALAYAAFGLKDDAVHFFEASLSWGVDTYAMNYAIYLSEFGTHKELREVVNRLITKYGSKTMLTFGWETNLFTGNIETALHYADRFIAIADEKDAEAMKNDAHGIAIESEKFRQKAGLTEDEYKDIAQKMIDVADNYGIRASSISFYFVAEEKTAAYILTLKTDDIDVIADMNIDIAFSLAENENLAGKRFSVWYRGTQEEENACN